MDTFLSIFGGLALMAYAIYCFLPKRGRGPSAKKALLAASSTMSAFQSDDYDRLDRKIVDYMVERQRLNSQVGFINLQRTILLEVMSLTENRYYWSTALPKDFLDSPRNMRRLSPYYQATHEGTATNIMVLIRQTIDAMEP